MRIKIVRRVPGYTNGRHLDAGTEVDLPYGLAVSLMEDGYAVLIGDAAIGRATPAESRETATAKRPGRPRKSEG
ncbi:hypothetical protein GCM10029963_28410 [Micromonospora andamanensis]|uniref:hypothetical protein n=1 Tax=Micromonospora andamanensis TaxID=1287068 RepID=UPI00195267F2|nr:hypothetical protein [Micromonospora andamanensis]GIJ38526.1 hypothetical protein Vwe01_18510 [Micromonospora andamanensis]